MPCDLCIKLQLAWVEFTVELALKGVLYTRLAKGFWMSGSPPPPPPPLIDPTTMILMSPDKGETAFHSCHCWGDMVVRMRKVLAIPRSWYVCFSA